MRPLLVCHLDLRTLQRSLQSNHSGKLCPGMTETASMTSALSKINLTGAVYVGIAANEPITII